MLFQQARIVLSWAKDPQDLDSHTIVPSIDPSSSSCDVSWNNKVCNKGHMQLDIDCVHGMGPETQTILQFDAGKYIYYVLEVFFCHNDSLFGYYPLFAF